MAYIKVNNVSKIYGKDELEVKALDNVSFEIEKGEFVVILGSSGAGKSTLLNILGGMDVATKGEYVLDSKSVTSFKEKDLQEFRRENIGFVFQFYNLLNNLTALENVEIAASLVKNPLDSKEVLNKVGLNDRMYNFPSKLSGGEQQRVSIARAIVKNPKLLLCDEPTGALDSKTGTKIIKLLYELSIKMGTTIIIVTHNSSLAQIGTRLIRIADGKIVENTKRERIEDIDSLIW
ncbi:MAG: ABC transporter ATP-binding protein [Bacilli bacterium]|nr:ABC transporter ATP-binding protein [Bacilli bacterium]MCI7621836.1 ABC transporter ATP-binding protein [Bacilli bacterium]MDD6226569.1 ABC transporter ATP-binding protein [Bacilli bacterium]MDD7374637.1 ABC transporter ATP-binding protein [Bacilli bacterium]MDD7549206.1 ABC transporter ATP-binding protein [Bacilli bacterium]